MTDNEYIVEILWQRSQFYQESLDNLKLSVQELSNQQSHDDIRHVDNIEKELTEMENSYNDNHLETIDGGLAENISKQIKFYKQILEKQSEEDEDYSNNVIIFLQGLQNFEGKEEVESPPNKKGKKKSKKSEPALLKFDFSDYKEYKNKLKHLANKFFDEKLIDSSIESAASDQENGSIHSLENGEGNRNQADDSENEKGSESSTQSRGKTPRKI